MRSLKSQLITAQVENYQFKWYIPVTEFERLLCEKNIRAAVAECHLEPYKQEEVVRTILNGGKKVFAVLILMAEEPSIVKFMEHDQLQNQPLDGKIPFGRAELIPILGPDKAVLFHREQWVVSSPLFRGDASHRTFDNATILPFTGNQKVGCGALGTVYEVTLEHKHQGDAISAKLPMDLRMVRKEMEMSTAIEMLPRVHDSLESLPREVHILSFLRLVRHPNIVRLIASYSYGNTYNLLLERAESDLETLLCTSKRPPALQSDDSFYQAMQGICAALAAFHQFTHHDYGIELKGYHHDLKPENILVHGSRFLLSDFGLSNLKEMSAKSKTLSKGVRGYYVAPECENIDDDFQKRMIGQASDVWALGCILGVLLTYIHKGAKGVAEFEKRRKYKVEGWTIYAFHCFGTTNPAVTAWLQELEEEFEERTNTEAVGLVCLVRDILKINPSDRPDAKIVSSRMDFLAAKSMYRSVAQSFDQITQSLDNPMVSIENERFTLFGCEIGLDTSSCERRNVFEMRDTKVEFKALKELLLNLQQHLEMLASCSNGSSVLPLVLKEIRGVVDHLWDMLSPLTRSKLENTLETRLVSTEDLTILDKVKQSFREDPKYRNVGLVAAMKAMILLADRKEVESKTLRLDPSLVTCFTTKINPSAELAEMEVGDGGAKREVLVEWFEYDARWRDSVGQELFLRVEAIAEILHDSEKPASFRSLQCIGYYHSKSRHSFGMVFDFLSLHVETPRLFGQQHRPITLASLIQETRGRRQRPSLGNIFELARLLAASVLEWHKVGWVHRAISAFTIIFFDSAFEPQLDSIKEPFFLGFQHSRPNEPSAFTLGPPDNPDLMDYSHPQHLEGRTRYLPEYDYYSLGLVLLEIGHWKTIKSLASKFTEEDQSPGKLKEWLLQTQVENLHMLMGTVYQEVVRVCMTFQGHKSPLELNTIPSDILEEFEEMVLEKLRLCFA